MPRSHQADHRQLVKSINTQIVLTMWHKVSRWHPSLHISRVRAVLPWVQLLTWVATAEVHY